jgi:glycosyltransferase involved in cell wall biosynthesis
MRFEVKTPVIEFANRCAEHPTVSIIMLTYNHGVFIEEAINGVINQKTDFTFELIIGEDHSTDNTLSICKKYALEHPDKIRLFIHNSDNKIKDIDGRPTAKFNLMYSFSKCKGKYIALCEGDDFWSDEYKLQKQVDFLETNTEYVAVFTDFDKLEYKSGLVKSNFNQNRHKISKDFGINSVNLFSENLKLLRTLTAIYRFETLKSFNFYYLFAAGDTQWIFHALQQGKIYYMNFSSGTYRVLEDSASHTKSFEKKQLFLENYVKFLEIIRKNSPLTIRDKRYIQKTILMSKLRRSAHEKNHLRFLTISLHLMVSFHWSRNIISNFKYAFRRSNSESISIKK